MVLFCLLFVVACSLSALVGCCLFLYAYCVVCSLLYFVDVCCRVWVGVIWSLFDVCGSSIYIGVVVFMGWCVLQFVCRRSLLVVCC